MDYIFQCMKIYMKQMNTNTSLCSWKVKKDEKDNNKEGKIPVQHKDICISENSGIGYQDPCEGLL